MGKKDLLVFIPTYNERDNVEKLLTEILDLNIKGLDILFIDDNSSDGTGQLLSRLSGKYKNVFVRHRVGKLGIGSAHKAGIRWAYRKNYRVLITMDSDMTHSPSYIPKLLKSGKSNDLVIASRYLSKKPMVGWNVLRSFMSYVSHFILKFLFKLEYDSSNSYRLYRLDKINEKFFSLIKSNSYSFFFESLYILKHNGVEITEIPVTLHKREAGESKMEMKDVVTHFKIMGSLMFRRLFKKSQIVMK